MTNIIIKPQGVEETVELGERPQLEWACQFARFYTNARKYALIWRSHIVICGSLEECITVDIVDGTAFRCVVLVTRSRSLAESLL